MVVDAVDDAEHGAAPRLLQRVLREAHDVVGQAVARLEPLLEVGALPGGEPGEPEVRRVVGVETNDVCAAAEEGGRKDTVKSEITAQEEGRGDVIYAWDSGAAQRAEGRVARACDAEAVGAVAHAVDGVYEAEEVGGGDVDDARREGEQLRERLRGLVGGGWLGAAK